MPTPITVNVNFIDLTGNPIQGYMQASIVSPTGVYDLYVQGTGIILPKILTSSTGTSVSLQVWGNDVVVDASDNLKDTYYTVNLFSVSNTLLWSASYLFTGSGPINLVGFPILNPVPPPPTVGGPTLFPPAGLTGDVQFNAGGVFGGSSGFTFQTGSLYEAPSLASAPVLTITQGGTPGSTSYSYVVFAINGNLSVISSKAVTTTTGAATLNGTNFNTLTWTASPGASGYNVYRVASSGSPATIGTLVANTSTLVVNDTGLATLDGSSPFSEFANTLFWQQNGYVGIQNGLQVGVPWTSISSNSPTLGAGQFNVLGAGATVQVNTISDPDNVNSFRTGCLSLTLDGFPNYLTTLTELSAALQIYVQGRVNPGNPSNNYQGIFGNLTVQVDTGNTGTGTSIGQFFTCGLQGAGSQSGSEGMFGSLFIMENNITGTCSDMSAYVAEYATFAASGTLTNFKFFNTHAFNPGGNTVTNAYGFYTAVSLAAATAFNSAFYTVNQGTGSSNYAFYSLGGNNVFTGIGTQTSLFQNLIASTGVLNQSSPSIILAGTAWNGAASVVDSWTIQDSVGTGSNPISTLSFTHIGPGATSINLSGTTVSTGNIVSNSIDASGNINGDSAAATAGSNQPSRIFNWNAAFWNGSSSVRDTWSWQSILGTGNNPTTTYTLTHSGSSGSATVNALFPWAVNTLTVTTATPTGTAGQVSFGTTAGFGAGSAGTAVTTTTKGAGTGPTTAQTVVDYLEIDIAGTKFWIPLMQ